MLEAKNDNVMLMWRSLRALLNDFEYRLTITFKSR